MKSAELSMSKRHILPMALASAALLSAGLVNNTYAASATGNTSATVVAPIAISESTALSFGSFARASGNTGGTIVMSTAGVRSKTGDIALSTVAGGNAASFAISGGNNLTYAVTLPAAGTIAISSGTGTSAMSIGTYTSNPSDTGTLNASGAGTLLIGATITSVANQVAGSYTGTYSISVEYN